MKKIFIDIFNSDRKYHEYSCRFYQYVLEKNFLLFTSCDLITTIYYIDAKRDTTQALQNIQLINKTLKVIEFSNKDIEETCNLMIDDTGYNDLEDTIQYMLAKKHKCNMIISNDKNFASKDLKLLTSEEFCKEYVC